jgi:hemolysin III
MSTLLLNDESALPPDTAISTGAKRVKPRLRGVSHQYAFFASLVAGPALVWTAPTPRVLVASAVYAFTLSALLGASALYHRVTWSPRARYWMGRLDLSMIFVMIAGSYTPIALLVLEEPTGTIVLWGAWIAAAAGITLKLLWQSPTKLATALVYVTMSSLGVVLMPEIARVLGVAPVSLLLAGGVFYIAGAAVYAFQRPDPLPAVFGYHEIFHALVIIAATTHYVAMAAYILRPQL